MFRIIKGEKRNQIKKSAFRGKAYVTGRAGEAMQVAKICKWAELKSVERENLSIYWSIVEISLLRARSLGGR